MKAGQLVYKVALPVPLRRVFDYLPPIEHPSVLTRGTRVKVPFGRQQLVGIVLDQADGSNLPITSLKTILSVCEPFALFPPSLCDLIQKAANYYHHPIGEVAFTGVPQSLRQGKPCELLDLSAVEPINISASKLILNTAQQAAVDSILQNPSQFQPFLLEGITGSGKTEVYLQVTENSVQNHKQILILIPEISLTPQTFERFKERFGSTVCSYHSRMTPSQRAKVWIRIRSDEPVIVIGTRSAVFLPFQHLGLIIIDEEHDPSFKQQEGFRYSARDIAVLRAQQSACPIVLGSATPAFETLSNVQIGKYKHLSLPHRATSSQLPHMALYDIRHKKLDGGLSSQLIARMKHHLENKGQVLLFINRRGFSPVLMCHGCGWMAKCDRCDARLTYHHKRGVLICHHCLHQRKHPHECPSCQTKELHPVGQGTERIEQVLEHHFPNIKIGRIDSDATRKKGSLDELLKQAESNETPLLIGTQILAKGHHFPHLSLVGIVDADGGLFSVDFRAIERMAQLIIQVAGRAGRVHHAGEVVIQTLHPEHPLLLQMLKQDYSQLALNLLEERRECQLPPFSHWALLRAESTQNELPEQFLKHIQNDLIKTGAPVSVLGPIPAPMQKRQGRFRFQLLIQSLHRKPLHEVLSYSTDLLERNPLSKKVRWSLDVDPIEMF
jgi:primosomal protein N' (replication factor Y) (superfamily II helicase)